MAARPGERRDEGNVDEKRSNPRRHAATSVRLAA
jgi:hypothetical protein